MTDTQISLAFTKCCQLCINIFLFAIVVRRMAMFDSLSVGLPLKSLSNFWIDCTDFVLTFMALRGLTVTFHLAPQSGLNFYLTQIQQNK